MEDSGTESNIDYGHPTREDSEEKDISKAILVLFWWRMTLFSATVQKNLSEGKLSFGLMVLAEETSKDSLVLIVDISGYS